MNKKKPDIVVWDETNGYDANRKHYPTSIGSPKFELPNVGLVKKESSKKMIDVFNRQREEIIQSILQNIFNHIMTSVLSKKDGKRGQVAIRQRFLINIFQDLRRSCGKTKVKSSP